MGRGVSHRAWRTLLGVAVVVSRSFRADTQRHRNAIGEAGRKASTDAYNATARFDGHVQALVAIARRRHMPAADCDDAPPPKRAREQRK